jgi:hypothetical protein
MKIEKISLWLVWFDVISELREGCSRTRTFLWFVVNAAAMTTRIDLAGVTSFVRCCWLKEKYYKSLLNNFNGSGVNLTRLTNCWMKLCFRIFAQHMCRVNGRIVLIADGIKVPKEGKKMPSVKLLHQESDCNKKAEFIMGHSCQAISLLVRGTGGFFAVPLISRIHEGVVFSNRSCQTLIDKLIRMLLNLSIDVPIYFVADGYYANKKVARSLLEQDNHLIARLRTNTVGYVPAARSKKPKRGRRKKYGRKLKLRNLFRNSKMVTTPSPVYSEKGIKISYRSIQLLWQPLGTMVQFVLVQHPRRGKILLLTTDLELDPLKVIELYGLRFKIEVSFKQAVHTVGTYGYHFWMMDMSPLKHNAGTQYLHRASESYRTQVKSKISAYHRHIQLGIIVQGLLQYLAVAYPKLVWKSFGSWLRTMKPELSPSELVVATAMQNLFPAFLLNSPNTNFFKKFIANKLEPHRCPEFLLGDFKLAA